MATPVDRRAERTPGVSATSSHTVEHLDKASNSEDDHADVEKGEGAVDAPALGSREEAEKHILTGTKLVLLCSGMLLSIFLVALDQTIVATAIPRIASDFNALEQVSWIASSYLLTQVGMTLTYGQILSVATTKWVYLMAVALFEVGSIICGASPNIDVLIFGRALSGVGAAGIFISALSIIARVMKLETRPVIFAMFGGLFAVSSIVGPLVGGAFTEYVSWRWCFYINPPLGAITILAILLFVKPEHSIPPVDSSVPTWKRIARLDWMGSVLSLGMITSLILPLQTGGVTKPWSDGSVIAPLVIFAVLIPTFVAWEWYKGDTALMPVKLWKRRTQIGCCFEAFCITLINMTGVYYLPLFYQSAERKSPTSSGISILSYLLSTVGAVLVTGFIIKRTGRPKPFLVCSPLLSAIGAGLIFWDLTSNNVSAHALYGYQVLMGVGVGCTIQNTVTIIQAKYHDQPRLVPQSTSLVNFTQLIGGIIGISVAGSIFGNRLSSGIAQYAPDLPSDTAAAVRQTVAVIYTLTGEDQEHVIHAYSEALGYVFILAIIAGIGASLFGMLVNNHNLKDMQKKKNVEAGGTDKA